MKTTIEQLLKQSTKQVNPDDREWVFQKVDHKKFARLIIEECIRITEEEETILSQLRSGSKTSRLKELLG